jgi:hypothetical protein
MMNKKVPLQVPSPGFRFRFRFIRAGAGEDPPQYLNQEPTGETKHVHGQGVEEEEEQEHRASTLCRLSREDAHARTCSMAVL